MVKTEPLNGIGSTREKINGFVYTFRMQILYTKTEYHEIKSEVSGTVGIIYVGLVFV